MYVFSKGRAVFCLLALLGWALFTFVYLFGSVKNLIAGGIAAVAGVAVFAFLVVNFLIAFAAPVVTDAAGIAWEAHLGGFAAGLLLLGAFDLGQRVDATL